jgi:DNA-binding response OmpR family regulator
MTNILIIEDEEPLRQLYRVILGQFNYGVVLAKTGAEGIEAAVREVPDMIILDLLLPNMSGLEVAKKLQSLGILPGTPLIITTGLGQGDAQAIAQSLNAGAVLIKPFNIDELVAAIRNALEVAEKG